MDDGTGRLRSAVVAVRHAPDRLLHPLRARQARAALPTLKPGDHILVLCHGNICRSPYAAAALMRSLSRVGTRGIVVESAGFVGPGRPMPAVGMEIAATRGFDFSTHRAQLLSAAMVHSARLILVMDPLQRALLEERALAERPVFLLGDFDDEPIATRAIRDPWNQPASVFAEVFTRLERCTAGVGEGIQAVTPRPPLRSGA